MKTNTLIKLDALLGAFAFTIFYPIYLLKKFILERFINRKKTNLIVKFLGTGNLIAIYDLIKESNYEILTTIKSKKSLEILLPGHKIYYINDENIYYLIVSTLTVCAKLFLSSFDKVLNLETESMFSKCIVSLACGQNSMGCSNTNKSIYDNLIYDKMIISPLLLDKVQSIKQLEQYNPTTNKAIDSIIKAHNCNINIIETITCSKTLLISPTCSSTDSNRRLDFESWHKIINRLMKYQNIQSIDVIFDSHNDVQYSQFKNLDFPKIKITVTSIEEYFNFVKNADLVLTIDSQTLHIAQLYNKKTICFYGPTSPFNINLKNNTYVVSNSLTCSPCTHKYLKVPCDGMKYCMDLEFNFLTRKL